MRKGTRRGVVHMIGPIGLALLALGIALAGCTAISSGDPEGPLTVEDVNFAASLGIDLADFEELPSGVHVRVDMAGTPPNAAPGSTLEVEFRGWLPVGNLITSSEPDEPFEFVLGGPTVLAGVQEGVEGMGVGELRTILVPPALGYGDEPPSGVPVDSWLIYEIRLLTVDGEGGELE